MSRRLAMHFDDLACSRALTSDGSKIETRSVREALACGCPELSHHLLNDGNPYREARKYAVRSFNPDETSKAMLAICEQVVGVPV